MLCISKLLPCALVLSLTATTAQADSVSGQFVLDGKAFKPVEVAAFRTQRLAEKGKYLTMVMLTQKGVDKVNIGSAPYAYDVAINDPSLKKSDFITMWVRESGEVGINASIGDNQYTNTSGEIAGQPGGLAATCKENIPTRVGCTLKTTHEVKTLSGHTYTLDVTFDADVIANKP